MTTAKTKAKAKETAEAKAKETAEAEPAPVSKNAYSYSLSLSGQAGEGGKEAAATIKAAFAKLLRTLNRAGIPVQGTLTGNVQPALDPVGGTALGDEVIHDVASDVLAAMED